MIGAANLDGTAERLRAITRDGGAIDAAQVRVIGLDDIREAAGARWPQMRDRVRNGSLSILSQHTGPNDLIIPAGDGFLVILADAPAIQVQRRCDQMREALLRFYLGEDSLKNLRPDVRGRSLSAEGLTDLIASASDRVRPITSARGPDIAKARIFAVHDRKASASVYAPLIAGGATRRLGYDPEFILDGRHIRGADYVDVDIALLGHALSMEETARGAGEHPAIGVFVHASTLQHRKSRDAYLSWMDEIAPEARRHLFVAIAEIEKGTPLISIAEWTSALRGRVPRVWLEFHYTDHAVDNLSSTGAWAAGFHLPASPAAQKHARAQRMLEQAAFWTRSMHAQGMRVFLGGFNNQSFLDETGRIGVDFASGDALWPFEVDSATPRATTSAADSGCATDHA